MRFSVIKQVPTHKREHYYLFRITSNLRRRMGKIYGWQDNVSHPKGRNTKWVLTVFPWNCRVRPNGGKVNILSIGNVLFCLLRLQRLVSKSTIRSFTANHSLITNELYISSSYRYNQPHIRSWSFSQAVSNQWSTALCSQQQHLRVSLDLLHPLRCEDCTRR